MGQPDSRLTAIIMHGTFAPAQRSPTERGSVTKHLLMNKGKETLKEGRRIAFYAEFTNS